jgi:hypothetical protein
MDKLFVVLILLLLAVFLFHPHYLHIGLGWRF